MTTVYLDGVLLLNLVVDYCLLAAAAKLGGCPGNRLRLVLAALLGAVYAGAGVFFPWLTHPVGQAAAGVAMVLAAYGRSHRLLRLGGLFLVLSCALGGCLTLFSAAQGGRGLSFRNILVAAALSYGMLSLGLGREFAHSKAQGELCTVTFTHRGRSVTLVALVDTGNTLSDPLTGSPVVVVEGARLAPLLPELDPLTGERLQDPAALLDQEGSRGLGLRLLPYRAVGVAWGMLLALRVDQVSWGGRQIRRCLTALSPTPLSDGGGYCALVGAETMGRNGT